ncbi:MAG TPA: ATP-binding protein [Gemmatimonadaceae bacterium]|nr:ATP-binding protein [Gemmatimonadaceae bacterium]
MPDDPAFPAAARYAPLSAYRDPCLALDASLCVLWANDAARTELEALGVPADCVVGCRLPDVATNPAMSGALAHCRRALEEQRAVQAELHVEAGDRHVAIDALPSSEGLLLAWRDVSVLRRLEQRVRHAQRTEAVGLLAGAIAHDFNNLLAAVKGFEGLLEMMLAGQPEALDCAREIGKATDRAGALAGQLLAYSRRQLPKLEALDLNARVREMQGILRVLAGERIALELALADGLSPVMADAVQVEQVLLNLVMNARDAMRAGGRIMIRTANVMLDAEFAAWGVRGTPGRHVRLDVSDTGAGMDEATRARIFDPFFSTKPSGTGLGLATVFTIVQQAGGHIRVESTPRQGTTFSVYLPAAGVVPAARPATPPGGIPMAGDGAPRRRTVLVVDDDGAVRDVLQRALARYRLWVLSASSGEDALRVSAEFDGPVDLLVTDMIMPGMNGMELHEAIRRVRPGIRTLFISGHIDDPVQRAIAAADSHFLAKPFSIEELEAAVRQVLA